VAFHAAVQVRGVAAREEFVASRESRPYPRPEVGPEGEGLDKQRARRAIFLWSDRSKIIVPTADWTKNGVIVGYRSIPQALDSKINFLGCIRISAGLQNRGRRFDSDLRLQS
jgi:hypothetical protein